MGTSAGQPTYRVAVFDFDGTLVDSNELEKVTMVETIHRYHDPFFRPDTIYSYFGPTEDGILRKVIAPEKIKEALSFFFDYYEKRQEDLLIPFPEMEEILKLLTEKGKRLFLLTGRSERTLRLSLKKLSYEAYFKKCYWGSPEGVNKPDSMRRLLEENRLEKKDVVYVGDTLEDIRSMKEVPVDLLSAGYSHSQTYGEELERNNPGNVCHTIRELKSKLMKLL